MDHYVVSARKYRPSTFASVVGQQALTSTLKNAIATDRLAHAYLFCGSRGVGKTSCARIFAKTINCTHRTPDGEACNECESCRQFNENRSMNILELDAASHNGIDEMRSLVEQVQVPPTSGRYRVFIIDEVHMLTTAAFNAFLKTLEEPPSYVIFILATTEKHRIIPTILSRCQIYDFNRITIDDMVQHMLYVASQEGITAEPSALSVIARKADGAMRDALSIFDQVASSSRGNITYQSTIDNLNVLDSTYYDRLIDAFVSGDVPGALLVYKEVRDRGFDSQFFVNGLAEYLRDLMVARDPRTLPLLETDAAEQTRLAAVAQKLPVPFYYTALRLTNDTDLSYRQAANKQLLVELMLIRLCQPLSPSADKGNAEGLDIDHIAPLQALKPVAVPHAAPAQPTTPQPPTASPTAVTPAAPQPSAPRPQATAPQTSPAPRPSRPTHTGYVSLTLKGMVGGDNKAPQTQGTNQQIGHDPYTDADMARAWDGYIDANSASHLLVAAMYAAKPVRTGGDTWLCEFDSASLKEAFDAHIADVTTAIQRALNNADIALVSSVREGQLMPYAWNERELMSHMVETYPAISQMIKDLKLKLR